MAMGVPPDGFRRLAGACGYQFRTSVGLRMDSGGGVGVSGRVQARCEKIAKCRELGIFSQDIFCAYIFRIEKSIFLVEKIAIIL